VNEPVLRTRRSGRPIPLRPLALALLLVSAAPVGAQSVLGHSPNVRGDWSLERWRTAFVFSHRFEFIQGGDELISLPTLTLGIGLAQRLAAGVDYTSNSEIVPGRLGANESQWWLTVKAVNSTRLHLGATIARNTVARSTDGAVTARVRFGPLSLIGEGRAYSSVFGSGSAGSAAAGGLVLRLTPHLELSGDVGRLLSPDTVSSVWSAGAAISIPGTPHSMSLHATNGGALTLQGASRPRVLGRESVRYGFTFTVPLGSWSRWARIFTRDAAEESDAAAVVTMRMIAYTPREVRIRAGETVEWVNRDPIEHTVTADDGSWTSAMMGDGQRFRRTFEQPGRYPYHCMPHPQMTGVVVVEPRSGPP
jgi:plastocyanin